VVSGFVGGSTVVSGDAEFKGMLRIDGRFTGRVRSEKGSLIVSAGGVVEANIEVASAKINGTVNGDIVATERVEFGRSARVCGNIQTPALVIEDGAIFEGSCRMSQAKPEPSTSRKAEESRAASAPAQPKQPAKPAQTTPAGTAAARAASVNVTVSEQTA
jgi:cytoskeletal protein CcmA (bactofilin family)